MYLMGFLIIGTIIVYCIIFSTLLKKEAKKLNILEDEKVIVETTNNNIKKILNVISIISAIIVAIVSINSIDAGDDHIAYVVYFIYIVLLLVLLSISKMRLVITDKRICGNAFWKQVDLPIDSISSVSKGLFNTLNVSTSSGKVIWLFFGTQDTVYSEISNLIIKRQKK